MFGVMLDQVKHDTISILSRIRIQSEQDLAKMEEQRRAAAAMEFKHANSAPLGQGMQGSKPVMNPEPESQSPFVRDGRKIGRNEPCPCGSGKKFKQCHGKLT